MANIGYQQVRISLDYDWGLKTGTWTTVPIDEILLDGTELIPDPSVFESEVADNTFLLDAYEWAGNLRHLRGAAGIPAVNTAFWIEVTPFSGVAQVIGGANGLLGSVAESGAKSIRDGRPFVDLIYSIIATDITDIVQDA